MLRLRVAVNSMATTSQKHRQFVSEPMGDKHVSALAGIKDVLALRLAQEGYDKVCGSWVSLSLSFSLSLYLSLSLSLPTFLPSLSPLLSQTLRHTLPTPSSFRYLSSPPFTTSFPFFSLSQSIIQIDHRRIICYFTTGLP